jgi:NADH-quinone oxidoreductase subunit H
MFFFLVVLAKVLFILIAAVAALAPVITWIERKQSAVMQDRIGANRADIGGITVLGLFHPIADVVKLFTKEDVVPEGANRALHLMAPLIAAVPAIAAFVVIPYGGVYQIGEESLSLVGADVDWGILYILAIGSLATYGGVIAGWSSNNNWSLLGGIRCTAQMISYEVTMGLSLVGVFMVFGTLKLTDMGVAQDGLIWLFGVPFPAWGIVLQPLGFLLFLTCVMAENKRPPFDLPEAESELVAGYFTEYSGMRFGLFYMSEFIEVIVIAALVTALFLGGWSIPYVPQETIIAVVGGWFGEGLGTIVCMLVHVAAFFVKVLFMIWLQMLIRWSFPRFRYDQVMNLCWKGILPLSIANIFATALVMLLRGSA